MDFSVKEFNTTEPLPSYVYCFNVGQWKVIKPANELTKQTQTSSTSNNNKKLSFHGKDLDSGKVEKKMRLFCTTQQFESLQRVNAEWYAINCFGLQFFKDFLDFEYPYSKYDITIVPKNTGYYPAMEYAGNMQFSEHLVEDNNTRKNSYLAFITFHELAHMWVGNLVSIEWWDQFYIKECFVEYLAQICYESFYKEMDGDKQGKYVHPKIWFARRKTQGMFDDFNPTTKRGLPADIQFAKQQSQNMTNIIYGKGFAVYEELFRILDTNGREFFRDFIRLFINNNQNSSVNEKSIETCLVKTLKKRG